MFKFLRKEKEPQNLEEVFLLLKKIRQENKEIKEELERIKEQSRFFIKKVKVARYNPFSNTGGNQSFSVVFLDQENNGSIITGLFTEGGSRAYAKQIEKGVSKNSLSKEEENLLKKTINS